MILMSAAVQSQPAQLTHSAYGSQAVCVLTQPRVPIIRLSWDERTMIDHSLALVALALVLAVSGCSVETSAEAEAEEFADAGQQLTDLERELAREEADAAMAVAVVQSEAAHEEATELCESQLGVASAKCKSEADYELEAAKQLAEATKLADSPAS